MTDKKLTQEELDQLPSMDVRGVDTIYFDPNAFGKVYNQTGEVLGVEDAQKYNIKIIMNNGRQYVLKKEFTKEDAKDKAIFIMGEFACGTLTMRGAYGTSYQALLDCDHISEILILDKED